MHFNVEFDRFNTFFKVLHCIYFKPVSIEAFGSSSGQFSSVSPFRCDNTVQFDARSLLENSLS